MRDRLVERAQEGDEVAFRELVDLDGDRCYAIAYPVIALGGLIYVAGSRLGPPATPSASPIDSSTWATFTSKRYGLSFKVPPKWMASGAHRSGPEISDDELSTGPMPGLMARSDPIPAGETEAEWWTRFWATLTLSSPCRVLQSDYGPTVIDGVNAYLFLGSPACGYARAYVLKRRRVYQLTAIPVGGPAGVDDNLFSAWLSTIRLDPGSADDSSLPTRPADRAQSGNASGPVGALPAVRRLDPARVRRLAIIERLRLVATL